jgi:hypothetical protein
MLTADTVINTPLGSPAVLIIENGQLDLNGHALTTSNGSAVTLVFSGDNPWSGVPIYQDPNLTSGLDVSAAGNSPTWNITGLIYMPHATVTLKGAIDKATAGKSCLVMVADNFQISGNGGILKTDIGQCAQAGLTMPTAKIPGRSMLIL